MSDSKDDAGAGDDIKVTLLSLEGERFEVPLRVAQMSDLVKTMIDPDELDDDAEDDHEVPLVNVKKHVLSKVIEYCQHHVDSPPKEIAKPLTSSDLSTLVSEWDAKFVDVEQELLFELILAANYMDIKPLLDLTCAKVASMIKGKSPEEIRKTFNIENDFTPEEENQVREENKWWADDAGAMVTLLSKTGDRFEVSVKVAQQSDVLSALIDPEEMEDDDDDEEREIPLVNVESHALSKVVEYMKHHMDAPAKEITKPLTSNDLASSGVSEWDRTFVDVDMQLLFELLLAANFMAVKALVELCIAKVATVVKDKSEEELRAHFRIINDFTPEEERFIRMENKAWIEDDHTEAEADGED